jgi:hypothetical protein
MNTRQITVVIGVVVGGLFANACGWEWPDGEVPCQDPNFEGFADEACIEARVHCRVPTHERFNSENCIGIRKNCNDPDFVAYWWNECVWIRELEEAQAAADAGAGADASSDPDAQSIRAECVPNEPNYFVAPQPVWFGPVGMAPHECPDDIGAFGGLEYFQLYVPSSDGCPKCGCGPTQGSCSPRPNSIHLRAAPCSEIQAYTTNFNAPENWNGECTSNHTLAANAECPVDSGIPCAQSVYSSALLDPTEGCKPITIPVPKAITDVPKWEQVALSCNASDLENDVPPDYCKKSKTPYPVIPKDDHWRYCVRPNLMGVYNCESGSAFKHRAVVYPKHAIMDHRSCTECSCKASGGVCYASFGLYEDNDCTKLLTKNLISSNDSFCSDINPPGLAIGSKEVSDLLYVPGTCTPTGGLPQGTVENDPSEAVTWCCLDAVYEYDVDHESE